MKQNLTSTQLKEEQIVTMQTKKLRAGFGAKILFLTMDLLYGRKGSLRKFKVLEVVARVPYIAWEQVSYIAITHTYSKPEFAREIHSEVSTHRAQQDNELFHLLIIEELLLKRGVSQGFIRFRAIPQIMAWFYYHLSWFLYAVRPKWSYALNAQFEDHAEHEYMKYVIDHPELEEEQWVSAFTEDYGSFETVADVLRQIAVDEREHKLESLSKIDEPRFKQKSEKT